MTPIASIPSSGSQGCLYIKWPINYLGLSNYSVPLRNRDAFGG
jgi:hypothetical protein